MFGLIRPLQIILNLPLLLISVPAVVSMIFEIIIPIAMFDIFESDEYDVLSMVLTFDTDAQ